METVVVRRSLAKTVLWLLAALVLIALGVALASGLFGAVEPPTRILGWFAAAAGVFGVARMVWQLRHTGLVLEIGPAGFHDRRLSAVPIPWPRIDAITMRDKPRQFVADRVGSDGPAIRPVRIGLVAGPRVARAQQGNTGHRDRDGPLAGRRVGGRCALARTAALTRDGTATVGSGSFPM
jgi:hypothetical protein